MFRKLASVIEHRSMKSVHEPFRQIRGELGLKSAEYLLDELEGDVNLICDLPEFFPQRDAPSSYNFIGPLYHSDERDEPEIRNFLNGPEKKILITMGSTGNWEKLSVLEDPDFDKYRFVLSSDRKSTFNIPNSLTRQFINQTAILPKIDLVICHGGNGTIYQALSCGVPVLCLPANFEAEWNSNRVQALGYGEVIESSYGPAKIDSMVQFWLKMRDTEKMQSIADRIRACTKMPLSLFQVAR
jgi:UDP:flavonoid glycosyltransferase YjiC (YdhE family)